MCPVLTGRSRGPAALGFYRGQEPVCGVFPVQKRTGCPRTPLEPSTGERYGPKHPWIRVMHRWIWVHFIMGFVSCSVTYQKPSV